MVSQITEEARTNAPKQVLLSSASRKLRIIPLGGAGETGAKNMTVFGNREGTGSPCLPGLAVSNIVVTPRNPSSGTSPTNPPRWVRVGISGYNFQPLFTKVVPIGSFAFSPNVEMRYVGLNAWLDQ